VTVTDLRRSPRARIEMQCTLHRRSGSPVTGRTLDVGPGGMRVCTSRPLAPDEMLRFELPGIDGNARVLRQQGHDTYAIRFELLGEPARAELRRLAMAPAR
jgi:PilZ domain